MFRKTALFLFAALMLITAAVPAWADEAADLQGYWEI